MTTNHFIHAASMTAALCLAACIPQQQTDDGGAGGAGGGQTDGGLNDAGGGNGGNGGEGGGCADCACAEIVDEATCDGRDDCATRRDVFGEFADCQDADDAMCRVLDQAQCGDRDDCDWAGGACGDRALACPDHQQADGCVAAGCYWWADQCNEEPAPSRCDQPDPASCEAANCEWNARGCVEPLPTCDQLERPACLAREECRFIADHCEDDPAHLPCDALDDQTCLMRGDCGLTQNGCVELQQGNCNELGEQMCIARADCAPQYGDADNCDECDQVFRSCARAEVDCRDVPPDACRRTPGCHVELDGCDCPPDVDCDCEICVPDEVGPCDDLTPNQCVRDPRCRVEVVEVCDERQAQGDADGAGFRAPDEDPAEPPPPCHEEQTCVERDGPVDCEDLDEQACVRNDRCELIQDDCECEAPDPVPCDCEDGDGCACAQPVPPPCDCGAECVPREGGNECEDLGADQCDGRDDCEWAEDGGGACACLVGPDGEEDCDCDEGGGFCQERRRDCADLDADACAGEAECVLEWLEDACDCADRGDNDGLCDCAAQPVCRDALDYCQDLGPRNCAQDAWCAWVQQEVCDDGEVPPPDCDGEGNCAGVPIGPGDCEEVAECVPSAWVCWDLDADACDGAPHCDWVEWDEEEPDCACVIDPDGNEDCDCGGGGGPGAGCVPSDAGGDRDDGDVGEPEPGDPGEPGGDGQEPDFFP